MNGHSATNFDAAPDRDASSLNMRLGESYSEKALGRRFVGRQEILG